MGSVSRAWNYTKEEFIDEVTKQGLEIMFIKNITYGKDQVPDADIATITNMILQISPNNMGKVMPRLLTDRYVFEITKG